MKKVKNIFQKITKRKIVFLGILLLIAGLFAWTHGDFDKTDDTSNREEYMSNIENVEENSEASINQSDEDDSTSVKDDEETIVNQIEDSKSNDVTIVMVGDMLLHDRVESSAKREDGSYNYDAIFSNVKDDIEKADIAIANQEVIIGGSELGISGYPTFNAPYEFGDALVETGFDIVCHGTNHALDKGEKGLTNCLNFWHENHPEIGVLGIHDSYEDQDEIYIYEINGIKIAMLNYTYGTNGIELPASMPYGVDYLSEDRIIEDLDEAEEIADFTIVCPHWGTEYSLTPDSSQKKWAGIMVAHGADLIIGTHPHVIEPVEVIEDEASGNSAVCYYSLGNFVNWTSGKGQGVSNRMVGAMATVTIGLDENNEVIIKEYDAVPLVSHVTSGTDGVTVYKLEDYTDELAEKNEIISQASDFSLEYCKNLVEEVLGK